MEIFATTGKQQFAFTGTGVPPHTAIDTLSPLERTVLEHMALGLSPDYIAHCIGIEDTDVVSNIIAAIYAKLGIQSSKNDNIDRARAAFIYLSST